MIFSFLNIKSDTSLRRTSAWSVAMLTSAILLTACQQPSEPVASDNEDQANTQMTQTEVEESKPGVQSDSAAARIEQFQPLYVEKMQGLQRRLQAEYEALQAADTPNNDNILLLDTGPVNTTEGSGTQSASTSAPNNSMQNSSEPIDRTVTSSDEATAATVDGTEINTSTEAGERDLQVLKRISLEPRKPSLLTENQIIERYKQALQALYQPASTPLSAQESDTLINIMTLLPQLFEHEEIANRVSIKSPALARLIVQQQVWQQIEAQQALDMQQMKLTQQQEFETLMTKFNDTIAGYDEQIAKYEQTLKEFQ